MKTLVAGWFSFENGHGTAGDLLARDLACEWLKQAGYAYDIAYVSPFDGDVDWRMVDPDSYSHVVFVCGPFERGELEAEFLRRFAHCRMIGLNLSMIEPLDEWNPFDLLFERNSSEAVSTDMVFLSEQPHVPVVGVCLVEAYDGALVEEANTAIRRLVDSKEMSVVQIDTRLDGNTTGLRSPAEIESLIARLDALITTRLHGTVLALKNGVPVVAIDPQAGGAKIRYQAEKIGWPKVFNADTLTDVALQNALAYCLSEDGRAKAREVADRAKAMVLQTRNRFVSALTHPEQWESNYIARIATDKTYPNIFINDGSKLNSHDSPTKLKRPALLETVVKTLNLVSWWTLPSPIRRWLRVQLRYRR